MSHKMQAVILKLMKQPMRVAVNATSYRTYLELHSIWTSDTQNITIERQQYLNNNRRKYRCNLATKKTAVNTTSCTPVLPWYVFLLTYSPPSAFLCLFSVATLKIHIEPPHDVWLCIFGTHKSTFNGTSSEEAV